MILRSDNPQDKLIAKSGDNQSAVRRYSYCEIDIRGLI